MQKERIVGKPVFRKEGIAKVCGAARYIDDFSLPGMIFGATVRSAIPRGRMLNIEFGPGIPWDEFTVVTAKDIPGKNYIALINQDWPCLADGFVNHPQEADFAAGASRPASAAAGGSCGADRIRRVALGSLH